MQPRFRTVRVAIRLLGAVLAAAFGVGYVLSFGVDNFGAELRHDPGVAVALVVTGFGFAGVLLAAPFAVAARMLRTPPGLLVAGVVLTVFSVVWYAWLLMHLDSSTAGIGFITGPALELAAVSVLAAAESGSGQGADGRPPP